MVCRNFTEIIIRFKVPNFLPAAAAHAEYTTGGGPKIFPIVLLFRPELSKVGDCVCMCECMRLNVIMRVKSKAEKRRGVKTIIGQTEKKTRRQETWRCVVFSFI